MRRPRVLLLVDVSFQCYRAAAAHPSLTSVDGTYTGGLYGFLQSFGKAVRETGATDAIACLDMPPYRRSLIYPAYKQLRKGRENVDLREAKEATLPLVKEVLEFMGVPLWGVRGFESDDLIASAVTNNLSRFSRFYAQSNDSDLFQLCRYPQFAVFKADLKDVVTAKTMKVTPDEHVLMSALTGTHNDIEGIAGVGPVKALAAIRNGGLLRRYRETHGGMIDRNLALIRLPHNDLPREPLPARGGGQGARALYRYLARYDIDCTLPMVDALDQLNGRI